MNKKRIFLSICLFIVFFSMLSVASAALVDNDTKSTANDDLNTVLRANNQGEILGNPAGNFTGLDGLIDATPDGQILPLDSNYTYSSGDEAFANGILIGKNITINGKGHTLDASNVATIFNITGNNHVILMNITFINANGTNGGAIKLDSKSTLEIISCNFINNHAQNNGAAIYLSDSFSTSSSLKITDSTFINNTAKSGGAIYLNESSTHSSTIENSSFINCTSSGDGGAAFISASNVAFRNVIFENNIAGDDGGAVYWQGSNGIIYNITCTNNRGISADKKDGDTSSSRGGTIAITGSNITVSKSRFIKGSAYMDESKDYSKVDGGALFITGNDVTIDDVDFISCNATNNGGAVYVIGNRTHIYNCEFTDCTARDGGALFVNGTECTLYNTTFTGNIANDDGGAIYWNGGNGYIYNITCDNNQGVSGYDPLEGKYSSTRGGTICLTGSNVTLTKSSFSLSSAYMDESRNYSKVDGGALFITGDDVIINDTVFTTCYATNNGGAIYVIGDRTHVYNCDFTDCLARDGGALFVNGTDCTLYNSTFTDNDANDDGGAIYWEGDNGYLYNITCVKNKGISGYDPLDGKNSNSKGGTICLTGSNVTIDESSFSISSAKSDGGTLFITGNDVKVLHSNFTDSIATASSGGAVYIIGNETHIFDCYFDDCKVNVNADYRGGAIYVAGNDANITKSTFTNTKALVGGAICINGTGTIVDGSTFSHNDAVSKTGGTGGAINIDGANAIIKNSEFSYGTAVNYGGAIAVWGSNAVLFNNTIDNSKTTKFNGGAVFVSGTNTTISLSNFTQCNSLGDTYSRGGAIDVEGDDTNILNCNFDDCDSHYGGVIYVSGTNANIDGSTFKDSEAKQGGAIYVEGTDTAISNSNFTDISADNYGGSIYVAGANANISTSNFVRSTVKNYNGGAIYVAGENTNIEKSNFTSASATNSRNKALGGAIYIQGANAVVKESEFDDCKASEGGGAIYAYGNDAKIEDSTFNSSTAKYGGAIYLTSWGSSITRSNITGSTATYNGGGVYVAEGSIQISESNFDYCIASGTASSNGGGAIYINGPDTHISASNFSGNKAPNSAARGGAIFIKGERTVIEGSEFDDSTANQGGVIYIEGKDALIDTSSFSNSSSKASGGSIYVTGDEATIRLSAFDNITAKNGDGGAIYVDGERTDILNSSFYNCTVNGKRGGAIYIDDIGTTVAYSNFTLSKAGEAGAIYIRGENTTISYCNLDKNVANTAGAIKVYGDDTIISNCNFTYNIAKTSTGGALDIGGANASVYYSWFDHNDAKLEGGAINWLGGHGDDSIIGSTFTNNRGNGTSRGGGAIYWAQGLPIASGGLIKDCIFINNTAAGKHGGAIDWFQTLDSVIENCLFINNTASSDGGALYTGDQGGNSVNLTIIYCQFYNNTAGKYGGAIANQMANSYIFNNTFDGNKAMAGGGTILMKEGPADNCIVDHCYIFNSYVGNLAEKWGEGGGAILIGIDSNITISNCAIMNSTIYRGPGGAIAIGGDDCSLINVSIQDSSTQNDDGGAIYWKAKNGNLNNVTIFNSSTHSRDSSRSSNGGAIYISGWYCNLDDIKIFQSSANNDENCAKTNYGGAIYVSGSYDVLTNIIIDNASSKNVKMNAAGGAIFYDGYGGTLINASISNTFATGNGGAIYWKGSTPTLIANISIIYSQTEVIDSVNTADGGAIYTTTVRELNNVSINGSRAYKNTGDVHGGAIYMKDGQILNNVTVVGSRASTDDGTSMGGAVYFMRDRGSTNVWVYNSTFEENNADLGGGLYFQKITARIYNTSFTGNVANQNGGALYSQNEDMFIYNSTLDHNSAKKGGAIFSQDGHIQISDSSFEFNTAEGEGGAIYYNYISKAGSSVLLRVNLLNNTAFQGSAMYGTQFNKMSLTDVTLLDNQANSKEFIEKHVGVDSEGNNYTSAIFLGFDNLLNAIWQESTYALSCTNVTYWGVGGKKKANSAPTQSNREVNINVTVEMYDGRGAQITTADLVTDKDGKVTYNFDAKDGETYYFAYVHKADRYYTYLRDTLSNRSIVNIYVHNPLFYSQNQTVLIELTDGAWGNLNGTVTVTFNDTQHTTFEIVVINGTGSKTNISGLPIGIYNATASFKGDLNHTGDTDWALFEVIPYNDLHITKGVDITADYVNVSDIIEYTITVTNHGPSKAYGVNVTERLSPYLKLVRSKATTGSYNLTGGYWYIGELDVDDFEKLTIVAEVIHMGPITNTVWVTGLGNDTNLTNNVASARNFTALDIVDLRIYKDVNVTTNVVNVLDVIKFNITVFNDGPSNATGVIVEELLDDHLEMISNNPSVGTYSKGTWNIGNLLKGANATLTIVARIVYSGNISNAVHVSGFENETNYTNNYAAIKNLTAIANVDLKITKIVNVTGIVNVTDKIKFTITVTNNGPCNATGVYVSETLSPHLKILSNNTSQGKYDGSTWIVGNLNKGDVHNLTIIAEVMSAGTISNAVAIFGSDNDTNKSNNNDTIENITSVNIVDLQINKTVDVTRNVVNVSDIVIFTIYVKNNGPCDATNVNVTEKLSPHLEMVDYHTWASTYNVTDGVWYIGNLAKGDWRQLVIHARVISAGNITNVVVVSGSENDTNKSNNKDEIPNITAVDIVDLQIKKEVNTTASVINVTDYIKYTITVFNDGPSNATNVNVSEVLSPHLKLINATTQFGTYNVTEGIWHIGELKNQSTAILTIEAQVISDGIISNVVVVNSTEKDTDLSNNRAEINNITAVSIVDLQIKKEVNVTSTVVDMHEIIKFNVTVYNAGPCNATNVYVCEPLSYNLVPINITKTHGRYDDRYTWVIGDLASGETATLTIVASIAYTGVIENEVNVTCNEIDINLTNNKDNITPFNVSALIDVGINKTVNVTRFVNVSDLVEFTVVAYNKGPSNASGIYVSEALDFTHLRLVSSKASKGVYDNQTTWYIGQLSKDENATLKIIAEVIAVGNFTNYVEIFGYGNDTNQSNNNDTIPNITARPVVDLNITKQVNVQSDVVNFGDTIIFTVTVRNNGPCAATNVTVNEVLDSHLEMESYSAVNSDYNVTSGVWYIGDLAKGDWRELIIEARVVSVGNITNVVNVTSTENDTNKSNNNASIPNITAIPIVDLKINKTVNVTGTVVNVTDYIKFTITVFNDGPCNATNVNVSEVLSPHLRLDKATTANGYYNVTEGIWHIDELKNQSTAVLTIEAQVVSEGIISNVVIVNATEKDTDPSDNKDEITNITAQIVFDLRIKKEVNVSSMEIDVTDKLTFNITVYNAGPCNATDVYVIEPLSDNLRIIRNTTSQGEYKGNVWFIGNLTVGANATLTIETSIAYGGVIVNAVNVTGRGIDYNLSNNKDSVTRNAVAHADLMVIKSDNLGENRVVNVSDFVEFVITAINIGPNNASGVYVIEDLDFTHLGRDYTYIPSPGTTYDGHTWYIGNLNVRGNAYLRIIAQVIAPGNFSNYVEIHGNDNDTDPSNNNASIKNITALPIVDLSITKESDVVNNTVYYNDTIKFTITVTNNGPCDATNVTVNEVLDSHLELISNTTWDGYYNVTNGVWYIGDMASGDLCRLEIVARVIAVGNITNVVNVTSTENDTNKSNNNASIPNITAIPIVDLRIEKTVNVNETEIQVTDVIKFTITVYNDGPCDAVNVYVYEPLSDCLSIINVTGNDTSTDKGYDGHKWIINTDQWYDEYTWVIGNLTNGTHTTLTIEARVAYSGIIENYVNVTSNMTDIDPSNNEDQITPITAVTKVDLSINKTCNVTTGVVNVGDLVEFTITATNNGPCNASGVYVLEALDFNYLAEYSREVAPGTTYDGYTWYIGHLDAGANATLKIVASVIAPGNFSNYVEIFGYDEDTNQSNNNATIPNITAIPVVDLDITKEVNVGSEVLVGDTVVFTITVRNNGPCDATNVNVTEKLSSHLEMVEYITWDSYYDVDNGVWYIGDLAKYDWRQIIIVTEVVSVGNISNSVSVISTENDTNKSNNNDTIPNITAKPAVDLQISKDVNVTSRFVEVNDIIEYTVTVYNAGPCNATNVNVNESLVYHLKFINATTQFGNYNVTEGIWHIGDLANGSTANLTIVAQVTSDGIVIPNVVVATSSENDTNPYNNRDEIIIAALPLVDLIITKEVNVTADELSVTDLIEFTITVYNDGPCNATGVYVIESLSDKLSLISNHTSQGHYDGYTWNIDNITKGNNVTLTIVAQVIYPGNISNAVVGYAYQNETNYTNNNASIKNITAITNVDLQITKKVNVSGIVNVTDLIEFTITVTNIGPCNATGVYVSEILNSHLKLISNKTSIGEYDGSTWVIGNLNKGETHNLTIIAEVISSGNISNVVNVTSNDNDTNRSNDNASIENITSVDIVDLNITKTVDITSNVVAIGDSIVFTITVWNNGPCDATNVNVSEVLSPHLKLVDYHTWNSSYNVTEGVWYIGDLAKNDWRQLILETEVISAGNITNVVNVTSTQNDTNKSNNNASSPNITALDVVDLTITKSVNAKDVVLVGQNIVFTITVRNIGICDATNVNVTEVLSPHIRMIGYSTWDSYYNVTEGMWYIGNLTKGDWRQLIIVAEVISAGNISNVVSIVSTENDTNTSNNNASIKNITALDIADLSINKTVDVTGDVVNVGDSVVFTITVRNNGPCDATNVNVTEVLSPHLKLVDYHTWDSSYNVTDGMWYIGNLANGDWRQLILETEVISAGIITNVVNVTSSQNDTNKSNNNASVPNITALDIADLSINKTVDVSSGVVAIGDSIVFTITVRNNGPCDATNVNVTEVLSPHLKLVDYHTWDSSYNVTDGMWYIGDLANGDWRQLILETEVISAGIITNVVNVTSSQDDNNTSNNNASTPNITAVDVVDLTITKEVNVGDSVLVGQTVIFTVTVRNIGICDATNVNVSEVLSPHLKLVSYHTWDSYYNVTEGIWYIGDLAKGDWRQLIIITEVVSAGNISNVVVVTSSENDTNKSNNNASIPNITANSAVDLYITKTANVSGEVNVFDIIEFDIVVYNAGPCNATNVNVSEVLSPHLKMINNITENGYYDVSEGIWHIGNLSNENRAYLSIIAQVISDGTISNVVVVTSSENDTDPSTNRDEIDNITAVSIVDLSVNKTVSTTTAKVGDEITYIITVHNYGPCDATDVNVTEKLSDYVALIRYNATIGDYDAAENIWYIGKLTNGSTHTLTLTVKVIEDGIIENSVIIKSNETDSNITNNNYTSENVTAEKYITPIDLKTENITYGEDEILVVILPENATGTVNITVGGRNYTDVPIDNGVVELPVTDLAAGDYNVTVVYGGDDKYLPNSTSGIFNVAKATPIITIEVADIWVWEIEVVNVTVNAPGVVFVKVNNITVEIPLENGVVTTNLLAAISESNYMGNATWNIIGLPVGTYPAFALYPGNENYTSVNTSDVFHVRDLMPTNVVVTADDVYVGEDAVININVGPEGVTGNVTVNVGGTNYTVPLTDGNATLVVPGLGAGTVNVTVWYEGNTYYLPSENTTDFDVLKVEPPVDIDAPEITVGEDGVITVTVPEDATGTITIEIDGERYTAEIENGKAVFIVPGLKVGVHDIVAFYSGDEKYLPANVTGEIKVNPVDNKTNGTVKHHGGIALSDYPTGNPIFVLLFILLAIGSIRIRRLKK